QIIKVSMERVKQYTENFEQYCSMVAHAKEMNIEHSLTQREWTPNEVRDAMSTFVKYIMEVKLMNVEHRIHMIKVMSFQYQEQCLPHLDIVVSTINEHLPTIAYSKNVKLLEIIESSLRKLDKDLITVEEFVEHLNFLRQIFLKVPSLEKEYTNVTQLYAIAYDYNISIPPEELALYQSLVPCFSQLKSSILFCQAKKDDNIIHFTWELDELIRNLYFELVGVKNKVRNPVLLQAETLSTVAKEILNNISEEVDVLSKKAQSFTIFQDHIHREIPEMKSTSVDILFSKSHADKTDTQKVTTELSEVEFHLTLRKLLWESQEEWENLYDKWMHTLFDQLNVDLIQKGVRRLSKTVYMLEKGLPPNDIVPSLKQAVMDFKRCLPVIVALRNPSLQLRHWDAIQHIFGRSINREKTFTLGNLLELKILQHKEKISDISAAATNEASLEAIMTTIIDLWNSTDFQLVAHQSETSTVKIIATAEDTLARLEESELAISTLKGSSYVKPIQSLVDEWDRKLHFFARTLEEWIKCQRNWLYFERIFLTPDIQRQLPAETRLFAQVDKTWKEIMMRTEKRPNALKAATTVGVLEMLQTSNAYFEKIQKGLENYLEIKQMVFPRFCFLTNEELIEMLAQSKDADAVQPYLIKCFENIKWLDIQKQSKSPSLVEMIISTENEKLPLLKVVRVRGSVEKWLGGVEASMYDTIKQ
uniref:Dynein heavy chain linker domain-containing protein n=2 Tax=Latimeria chalumnae TaxID=7897 RepID=H3AGF2_LATCH